MTFGNLFQLLCIILILVSSIVWTVVIFKEESRRPLFGRESLAIGWKMLGFMNIPFLAIPLSLLCGVDVIGAVIAAVLYSSLAAWFIVDIKFINPYNGEHRKARGYY